jgi:hypothetical protein
MKPGDRIKVVWSDEYSEQVRKAQNIQSPVGMTGTIIKVCYNRNMGCSEVYARMDGRDDRNSSHLWFENEVEVIK